MNEWGCPHDAEVQRLAALLGYKISVLVSFFVAMVVLLKS
jgi:hypothetical protein